MNRLMLLFVSAACVVTASAKVKVGENLIYNGTFDGDQVEFPNGWVTQPAALGHAEWRQSGGPDGLPSVTLEIPTDEKIDSRLREDRGLQQDGLKLSEKGRFRIRARLRATGFRQGNPGKDLFVIGVTDDRVEKVRGITAFPSECEGRWTEVSAEVEGFPSKTGSYTFFVFAQRFAGKLEVADVSVAAIDDEAAAGTMPGFAAQLGTLPRIVPWEPLLGEIPETTREMTFRFFGALPEGTSAADYDLALAVAGTSAKVAQPLAADGFNRIWVPAGRDEGVLEMKVVNRASGAELVARSFRYRIAKVPSAAHLKKHRKLNALVTEILRAKAGDGPLSFGTARRGWVYVSVGAKAGAALSVKLDGAEVIATDTPRFETVREIPSGDHALEVAGAADGDEVIVRQIPEIFNYCTADPVVKENGPYVWDFVEKRVLYGVTTLDGGNVPPEVRASVKRRGYLWIDNMHSLKLTDDDDLYNRFVARKSLSGDVQDGVSLDEQHWYEFEHCSRLMKSMRRYDLEKRPDKAFYTWVIGKPLRLESDTDVMSACANMSYGRAKIATEVYCRTKATEQEAEDYITQYIRGTAKRYRELHPFMIGSLGIVLGNFNQWPVLSCCHHPEVDYREFLDRQVRALATDPVFDGLGMVGYWGSYYADKELHDWSFRLMRHYCIEGRTTSLAGACGLKYLPGHVANGDFRGTLAPWSVDGSVETKVHAGLGYATEGRWGGNNGLGDTYAEFARGETPNRLRQTLKGLEPGKRYYLQFVTFDADALRAGKAKSVRFGLDAVFGAGASVDGAASWVHVDRRSVGRYGDKHRTTPNVHHVVFTAQAPDVELTFTDVAAKPGEKLGMNGVGVYRALTTEE